MSEDVLRSNKNNNFVMKISCLRTECYNRKSVKQSSSELLLFYALVNVFAIAVVIGFDFSFNTTKKFMSRIQK